MLEAAGFHAYEVDDDREKIIDGVKVIFQQNGDVMINGKTFCKEGVEEFIAEYTRKI